MGTYQRVLNECYLMNTNMTVMSVFKNLCVLVLLTKVASALEGLKQDYIIMYILLTCLADPCYEYLLFLEIFIY